ALSSTVEEGSILCFFPNLCKGHEHSRAWHKADKIPSFSSAHLSVPLATKKALTAKAHRQKRSSPHDNPCCTKIPHFQITAPYTRKVHRSCDRMQAGQKGDPANSSR